MKEEKYYYYQLSPYAKNIYKLVEIKDEEFYTFILVAIEYIFHSTYIRELRNKRRYFVDTNYKLIV